MDRGRCANSSGDRTDRLRGNIHAGGSRVPLDSSSRRVLQQLHTAFWIQWRRIQRSIWTGGGGIVRQGEQRVQVKLQTVDIGGSEGDRQGDILHGIQEGDEFGLGEGRDQG